MTTEVSGVQAAPFKASYQGVGEFRREVVLDRHCGLVCKVEHGYGPNGEEHAKKTAALFAAAPDLLLAAKEAVLILNEVAKAHKIPATSLIAPQRLMAAIQKAEGRTE